MRKWLKTKGDKGENDVLQPPPLDQWASDMLDNVVQKPARVNQHPQ
jgi:hypothetical protein